MIKTVFGLIIGAIVGLIADASIWGLLVFAAAGLVSGYLADREIGTVEPFYWAMLLLQVVLLAISVLVIALPGPLVVVPLAMVIARLTANAMGWAVGRFRKT